MVHPAPKSCLLPETLAKPVNFRKWQRIAPGDIVLYVMNGRFVRTGTVTFLFHNPELALTLPHATSLTSGSISMAK